MRKFLHDLFAYIHWIKFSELHICSSIEFLRKSTRLQTSHKKALEYEDYKNQPIMLSEHTRHVSTYYTLQVHSE